MEQWAAEQFNPFAQLVDWVLYGSGFKPRPADANVRRLASELAAQTRKMTTIQHQFDGLRRRQRVYNVVVLGILALSAYAIWP